MTRKLSKPQDTALYYIELDGGLMKTHGAGEWPYTTPKGRGIHAVTAEWLIKNDHLIAHQDGIGGVSQSWEVKHKRMS